MLTLFAAPYLQSHRNYLQRWQTGRSRITQSGGSSGSSGGVVPAVVKVVNVISDIGHGAQKVAKKVGKASQPLISHSAAQWRRTVDQHIMPSLNQGLAFVGEKAAEGLSSGVDVIADAVMGSEAKDETSVAFQTLHRALVYPNDTSTFLPNHDVIQYEPKARMLLHVSDISPCHSQPISQQFCRPVHCTG